MGWVPKKEYNLTLRQKNWALQKVLEQKNSQEVRAPTIYDRMVANVKAERAGVSVVSTPVTTKQPMDARARQQQMLAKYTPEELVSKAQGMIENFYKSSRDFYDFQSINEVYSKGNAAKRMWSHCRKYVDSKAYAQVEKSLSDVLHSLDAYIEDIAESYRTDEQRTQAITLANIQQKSGGKLTYSDVEKMIVHLDAQIAFGAGNVKQLQAERDVLKKAGSYGLYTTVESYDQAIAKLENELKKKNAFSFNFATRIENKEAVQELNQEKKDLESNRAALQNAQYLQSLASLPEQRDFLDKIIPAPERGDNEYGIPDEQYFRINRLGKYAEMSDAAFKVRYGNTGVPSNEIAFRITQDERDLYNYLYHERGKAAADEYLDRAVYPRVNAEITEEHFEKSKQFAEKKGVLATFASFATKLAQTVESTPMKLVASASGSKEYRRNAAFYDRTVTVTDTIRQTQAAAAAEKGKGLDIVYQVAMTAGDIMASILVSKGIGMVAGGLGVTGKIADALTKLDKGDDIVNGVWDIASKNITKNVTNVLLSSEAASEAMTDARNRNLSDMEILSEGLVTFTIEMLSRSVSLNDLLNTPASTIGKALKTAFANVSDDLLASAATMFADSLIAGDRSRWNLSVQRYVQENIPPNEAIKKALGDSFRQVAQEALVSLLMGGVIESSKMAYAALANTSIRRKVPWSTFTNITEAHIVALKNVSEAADGAKRMNINGVTLYVKALRSAICATDSPSEALALSTVPEVLAEKTVLESDGTRTAVGTTVDIQGVPHTIAAEITKAPDGGEIVTAILLDGNTRFDVSKEQKFDFGKKTLAISSKEQYTENRKVTDEDLTAALLEDWKSDDAPRAKNKVGLSGVTDVEIPDHLLDERVGEERYKGLTVDQNEWLQKNTHWSNELITRIRSAQEANLYIKFNLQERQIGGRICLLPPDLDLGKKDWLGKTNAERLKDGYPPVYLGEEVYEVHHIGQKMDSPFAVLTSEQHRGKGIDAVLHHKGQPSEIDRNVFKQQKRQLWKEWIGILESEELLP